MGSPSYHQNTSTEVTIKNYTVKLVSINNNNPSKKYVYQAEYTVSQTSDFSFPISDGTNTFNSVIENFDVFIIDNTTYSPCTFKITEPNFEDTKFITDIFTSSVPLVSFSYNSNGNPYAYLVE